MTVKKPAASTPLWGEKPYRSLDYEWKKQYGEKIYKVSLNGGMTWSQPGRHRGKRRLYFLQRRRKR